MLNSSAEGALVEGGLSWREWGDACGETGWTVAVEDGVAAYAGQQGNIPQTDDVPNVEEAVSTEFRACGARARAGVWLR